MARKPKVDPLDPETGKPRCTARTKGGRGRCKNAPVTGRHTCRMHGGTQPIGPDNPNYVHGKYSKMPGNLRASYERARSDPEVLNGTDDIALIHARIETVLENQDTHALHDTWKSLRSEFKEFQKALARDDVPGMRDAMVNLESLINTGAGESAAWVEIGNLVERKRRLMETEGKRRVTMQQLVALDSLDSLLERLVSLITENVPDPHARKRIHDGLYSLAN